MESVPGSQHRFQNLPRHAQKRRWRAAGRHRRRHARRPRAHRHQDRPRRSRPPRSGRHVGHPGRHARLPPHFRPVSLGGFGKLPVFGVETTKLGDLLFYRPDLKKPTRHGYVEPRTVMAIAAYQGAIAATAPHWQEIV